MKLVCRILFIASLCHCVSMAMECTAAGKFPNDDPECRGYTMCLAGPNGFMQFNVTCPGTFVYSHMEEKCTNATTYRCKPSFSCNVTGNFENPSSENCSSFVACVTGISGIVTARRIQCRPDSIFNPREGVCVNSTEYQCPNENENVLDPIILVQNNTDIELKDVKEINVSPSVSLNNAVGVCCNAFVLCIMIFIHLY